MKLLLLYVALFPAFAGAAQAQSFNCQKAADVVDRAICSTPELSALDTRLGSTWQNFRAQRPDLVQQAKSEGLIWLKHRKLCIDSPNIVDCIRDAETTRIQRLSALLPVPSTATTGVDASASSKVASVPDLPLPDHRERVFYGEHVSESASVIGEYGFGTTVASLTILLDWNRELRGCSDEYLTYESNAPDPAAYTRCVDYARKAFVRPQETTAHANCETGRFVSFSDTIPRFYVGQVRQDYPASDGKMMTSYIPVMSYEGFRVGNYGYTNVDTDGALFRKMCPTSFVDPPKIDLPELDLHLDCAKSLDEAERIATGSGILHVLNESIIDAWDVKSDGDTWFESKCSAKVQLSNAKQATLSFKKIPLHGRYFLQADLEPSND